MEKESLEACKFTGYVQRSVCKQPFDEPVVVKANQTKKLPNKRQLVKSCAPNNYDVESVVQFELCMAIIAVYSFNYVRKRRRQAYQRLSNIVNS